MKLQIALTCVLGVGILYLLWLALLSWFTTDQDDELDQWLLSHTTTNSYPTTDERHPA